MRPPARRDFGFRSLLGMEHREKSKKSDDRGQMTDDSESNGQLVDKSNDSEWPQ